MVSDDPTQPAPGFPGVRGLFLGALREVLPELREAAGSRDWERVWRVAHRLRGSAEMFGVGVVSAPAAVFQAAWGRSKGPSGVKAESELVESAQALVRACERVLVSES